MIGESIHKLISYGVTCELIQKEDQNYCINRLLEVLQRSSLEDTPELTINKTECETDVLKTENLEKILKPLLEDAITRGLIEDTQTERDLFDTKLMGTLVPRPSEVIRKFQTCYASSPKQATEYFYSLSQASDYIRSYRIEKDQKWKTQTPFGALDITINLSKPEKDPKAIAAARSQKPSGYPKCLLCAENEGYAGRLDHPARQNHRIIPLTIEGEAWGFQYSPYVYYNEHCIVFNQKHIPMKIDKAAFRKLFSFVEQFPHYFVGSNADLPIVGGSILTHEHFQGGNYEFAMAKASLEEKFTFQGYPDIEAGIVNWPMSVIRLTGDEPGKLTELADHILQLWRAYTDEEAFIFAETNGEPHNTITPIARRRGTKFELDLVLRNNITTQEHPLGVFHPHAGLHHIKKENIGLIEVMGLAVLPSRLQKELTLLEEALVAGTDISSDECLSKHAEWSNELQKKYPQISADNVGQILREETGQVFLQVLMDAGVYKTTNEGRNQFRRFLHSAGMAD